MTTPRTQSASTINKRTRDEVGQTGSSPNAKNGKTKPTETLDEKFDKVMIMMTGMNDKMSTMKQEIKEEIQMLSELSAKRRCKRWEGKYKS